LVVELEPSDLIPPFLAAGSPKENKKEKREQIKPREEQKESRDVYDKASSKIRKKH